MPAVERFYQDPLVVLALTSTLYNLEVIRKRLKRSCLQNAGSVRAGDVC